MKTGKLYPAIVAAALAALLTIIASTAFAVDITGHWRGSNGVEYDIIQTGNAFEWKVPATGEIGIGNINGMDCSAGWPFGFATGHIVANPSGAAVEIVWSNGVFFQRPAPGGGPGPGPGPGPTPGPSPTPGGGSGGLVYNFGPNPAWPGATVWVKLSLPVAHEIKVWHNGQVMPITKFVNNNEVEVTLPTKVDSGPFRVEYQGKRLDANQPNKDMQIKPLDISGQWESTNKSFPTAVSFKQNGATFVVTMTDPTWGTSTYDGEIRDGIIVRFYTSKGKSVYVEYIVDAVNPQGRAMAMVNNSNGFRIERK